MIIEMILDALYNIFSTLTSAINIPDLPDSVCTSIDGVLKYLQAGAGIIANYVDLPAFLAVLAIIVAVDLGINVYHFVMWILRKIPMIGIE